MPSTSPIPVLRGSGGVVLQVEDDDLVLTGGRKKTRIPFRAVLSVWAQGRAVTIELTAPAGSTPAVYRIGGMGEAAATVFADVVNASLPERADGSAEVVDGRALVTVTREESGEDAWFVNVAVWWWTAGLLIVAMTVVIGFVGSVVWAVIFAVITPFGLVTTLGTLLQGKEMYDVWVLPLRGIIVEAQRSGMYYRYTDMHGVTRTASDTLGRITGPTAQVAYHPRRPGTAAFVNPWGRKVWFTFLHLVVLLIGLAIDAGSVAIVVEAFRG
ncbi:hypothetical protein [Streptomyces sp. NPDC056463]|uniref:hypothetical protein n=1 Tax=unclassified Streptomyces TaxID=2593676 RepID=UPI0036A7174F